MINPSEIARHRLHDNLYHDVCQFCSVEKSMQARLTPESFREWMNRDDHEESLKAFCAGE